MPPEEGLITTVPKGRGKGTLTVRSGRIYEGSGNRQKNNEVGKKGTTG